MRITSALLSIAFAFPLFSQSKPAVCVNADPNILHPCQQPLFSNPPPPKTVGDRIVVTTPTTFFPQPAVNPFDLPPGTNFLPSVFSNNFDVNFTEMPNTLPSTPLVPYNLHDGDPKVSKISAISPTDDLTRIFGHVIDIAGQSSKSNEDRAAARRAIGMAIDILEGNPIPNRVYSGLPLLHYDGPNKVKSVVAIRDSSGKVVGGNVDVHQVWYDSHIEADTAFIDPRVDAGGPLPTVIEVPWTITYTVDVLTRGEDDFSPYVMYTNGAGMPGVGMDQSFFPMAEGTRTVFKIKMAPGKYFSLVYTWGWRYHPPRAQVMENATKELGGKTLPQFEIDTFGANPRQNEQTKLAAIAKIGDLSPEKRMWNALRGARAALDKGSWPEVDRLVRTANNAFSDWQDRTRLPWGTRNRVRADQTADLTLLYANNTIYAEPSGKIDHSGSLQIDYPKWKMRGTTLNVTLYNADNFEHAYQNVDFGGARGWENQFKSSVKFGGSGCWFTFGRNYWWMNVPNTGPSPNGTAAIIVPPADATGKPGMKKVSIEYNYEPSRRIRFYQFDPFHHDVAILSVH